eukprot:2449999-Pyramimonas_sp.AAC.1
MGVENKAICATVHFMLGYSCACWCCDEVETLLQETCRTTAAGYCMTNVRSNDDISSQTFHEHQQARAGRADGASSTGRDTGCIVNYASSSRQSPVSAHDHFCSARRSLEGVVLAGTKPPQHQHAHHLLNKRRNTDAQQSILWNAVSTDVYVAIFGKLDCFSLLSVCDPLSP